MYRHILVPVDLSDRNHPTLETAVDLARIHDGKVTVLHVIETIQHMDFDESREFFALLEEKAKKKIRELMAPWDDDEISIKAELRYGKPVKEIVMFSVTNRCDLIVLSSHRVDVQEMSRGLGTVSHQVAYFAQTPVLLVK
ncbi:MAG: universal stress protein [Acidobacteria bacterium]|nr:universal stress protein [Acidobacteriota bacterium]